MKTFLALILFLGFLRPSNLPCGCDESNSIETEIVQSDLVVSGLVSKKTIISRFERDSSFKRHKLILVRYEIEILKFYKGVNSHKKFFMYSMNDSASCGLKLDIDKKYIIFAKKGTFITSDAQNILTPAERKGYWSNTCSKTAPFNVEMELGIERSIED